MVLSLVACGTNTPVPTNDYCRLYSPIFDHVKDTLGTRNQVRDRNAIYECVCQGNCPVALLDFVGVPTGINTTL